MKPQKFKRYLIAIVLVSMSIISCKKYNFNKLAQNAWNPNLAIPLAYATFGVYDILANTDSTDLVVISSTGEIALVYSSEVTSLSAQDFVEMPNFNEQISFDVSDLNVVPIPIFPQGSSVSVPLNETINFETEDGVELKEINFKGGDLIISASSNFRHTISVELTLPDMRLNNVPISRQLNLEYNGFTPTNSVVAIDLADVIADLTLGGTTSNQFGVNFNLTISGSGQSIEGNEEISVNFSFANLSFKNARGYFGQQSLGEVSDSILVNLFENSTEGHFELTNPKVKFTIENSFGFPINLYFSNMKTINAFTNNEYPLTGFPATFSLLAPANINSGSVTSYFELNNSNTQNLSTIITPVPKYFTYDMASLSNPAGIGTENFIHENSMFNLHAELEMPLEGFAYGFVIQDTVEFSMGESIKEIESIMFRLNIENGFPVEVATQVIALDENFNHLFQLFTQDETVIKAAPTGASGKVSSTEKKITDIHVSEENIEDLLRTKHLLIRGVAETTNGTTGQIIKLYDDYKIFVKLGMQVQGGIKF
jgi:hypothetical protein